MENYQSKKLNLSGMVIGFVSNDKDHFNWFKKINKHNTVILVNENVSLIGLKFNLIINTEDSSKMSEDFKKAVKLRTVKI